MARIDLINLRKEWPTPSGPAVALEDIDVTFAEGELVAILGPSGCGKSTTLFLMAGIYVPSAGEIRFDGQRVNEVEARDRNVGIVFQSYALYPHMTVRENIGFPLRFKGVDKATARRRAEEMAALVQVDALLERRPGQLSGGQQQRVALARALIKEPNLLLLDEPLSNLDATLRMTMRTEIKRIQRRLGVTSVLVTHDQIEATTMADRIICMNRGKIEQTGSSDDLYRRPDSLFVAGFIGSPPINLLDGEVEDGRFASGSGGLAITADHRGPCAVGLRPEDLVPADAGIPATVQAVEPMGRETIYQTDTPLGPMHFLLPERDGQAYRIDDRLALTFDPARSLLFDRQSGRRIAGGTAHAPAD